MEIYFAEFIGTLILILLGNGVVANVLLKDTKGHASGWVLISLGWGLAVFVAVLCVGAISDAHINPAVTIGLAATPDNGFNWSDAPGYIVSQMLGAFAGAVLVYVFYYGHYIRTEDGDAKLGTFCTGPAIRSPLSNLFSEIVGTFILVFAVLRAADPSFLMEVADPTLKDLETVKLGLGAVGALPVALIVAAIGISLGGTTGYAINPARDLGPRIAHALLPIPKKRDSDWSYSWIPVVGPIVGALIAAVVSAWMG